MKKIYGSLAGSFIAFFCLLISCVSSSLAQGPDIRVNQDPPGLVQNTTSIVVNNNMPGNMVVAYNDDPFSANGLGISFTLNNGLSWQDRNIPALWGTELDPSVTGDANGRIFAGFASYNAFFFGQSGIYVSASLDGGNTWGFPVAVSFQSSTGLPVPFDIKPKIEADANMLSPNANFLYACWERDNINAVNSDILVSRSTDNGITFSAPLRINDIAPNMSLGLWPEPAVAPNGNLFVSWLDAPYWVQAPGQMFVDRSFNGGQTFGGDVLAANLWTVGQTLNGGGMGSFGSILSYPSIVVSPQNSNDIYIAYAADPDAGFVRDQRLDLGSAPGSANSYVQALPPGTNIAANGRAVYAVYADDRNGNEDIYFNYSPDGGATWQNPDIRLDTDPPGAGQSVGPVIATSGNFVYVAWVDNRNGAGDIYFNYSANNGMTWQATDIRLNTGVLPGSGGGGAPDIACTGNNVYVVWEDFRNGVLNSDIFFNYSLNNGASWQPLDIGIDIGPYRAAGPAISSGLNNVFVSWADMRNDPTMLNSDIFFNTSFNNGALWLPNAIRLNTGSAPGSAVNYGPEICSSAGNVYVSWNDGRNLIDNTYFNYSTNGGLTWQTPDIYLNTGVPAGAFRCYRQRIACNGQNVFVVWEDERPALGGGTDDIYLNYSQNGGQTWQTPDIRINNGRAPGSAHSGEPRIASAGNMVGVAYMDNRNGVYDIYFNYSGNNGQTWNPADLRSSSTSATGIANAYLPQIAASGTDIYVMWQDQRNGLWDIYFASLFGPDDGDIFFVRSNDGGFSWAPPIRVNDDNTLNDQVQPWVDVKPNGAIDVVFYDRRNDPNDIQVETFMAVSNNGGQSFLPNFPVSDFPVIPTNWMGDYTGLDVDMLNAYPVWTDTRADLLFADVYLDVYRNPGTTSPGCGKDTGEPNNTMAQAKNLMNGAIGGFRDWKICPLGDVDWFYVDNPFSNRTLRVRLMDLYADYDIRLYDASGSPLDSSLQIGWVNESITRINALPGRYYIKVSGKANSWSPFKAYSLTASFMMAAPKPVQAVKPGALPQMAKEGSLDFKVFPNPASDMIHLEVLVEESGSIGFTVVDIHGRQLLSETRAVASGMNELNIELGSLPEGVYFFRLTGSSGYEFGNGKLMIRR
jgi:hypothetical protein